MTCFPEGNQTRKVKGPHEYRYVAPLWYLLLNDLLLSGGMLKGLQAVLRGDAHLERSVGCLHRSAPQHGCSGLGGAGRGGPEEHITDMQLVRDIVTRAQTRVHRCPHCGFEAYPDVNVAENILVETRAGRARSHACGDPAYTPAIDGGGQAESQKQELYAVSPSGRYTLEARGFYPREDVTIAPQARMAPCPGHRGHDTG
jgi:ribosomal protein L37AE/L43A